MQFLSRLLKREEAPATITLAEHEAALATICQLRDAATLDAQTIRGLETIAARYRQERDFARLSAEANAADATLWRNARAKRKDARSNLKQFRDQKAVANG